MQLDPEFKKQITQLIALDSLYVELNREPGTDVYKLIDPDTKETVVECVDGWDYGAYMISLYGTLVASIKWRENDGITTAFQQDVFDVLDLFIKKHKKQEWLKQLASEKRAIYNKAAKLLQNHSPQPSSIKTYITNNKKR